MSELMNKVEEYKKLRNTIDGIKEELKTLNAEKDNLEEKIIDEMEMEDLSSIRMSDGSQVIRSVKFYPSMQDRDAVFAWFKKEGLWDDMATINTRTFQAFVKERVEAGEPEPDGTHIEYINKLSLRRS